MSMDKDGNLEQRKAIDDKRNPGNIQKLVDALQSLIELRTDIREYDGETDSAQYNEEAIEEIEETLHELRSFDITEVGSLYLTPKKRVVLDKGYGEYFTDADIELFSKEELHAGVNVGKFQKRLEEAKEEMGIDE